MTDNYHYETYETREVGEFEYEGAIWDEKLTYSDGSVCYGRSNAPKLNYERGNQKIGLGSILRAVILIALLVIIARQFMLPL